MIIARGFFTIKKFMSTTTSPSTATFGAGCFWGVEKSFRRKFINNGALDVKVGYAGGHKDNVTYREVCSGKTGHAEVVQIKYDPSQLSYEVLVDFFYRMHDPTTLNSQGNDHGTQYRSAIFYHNNQQKELAEKGTAKANVHYGNKITTTIEPIGKYFPGEDYHQDYLEKNPHGYECATHFERTWESIAQKFKL